MKRAFGGRRHAGRKARGTWGGPAATLKGRPARPCAAQTGGGERACQQVPGKGFQAGAGVARACSEVGACLACSVNGGGPVSVDQKESDGTEIRGGSKVEASWGRGARGCRRTWLLLRVRRTPVGQEKVEAIPSSHAAITS